MAIVNQLQRIIDELVIVGFSVSKLTLGSDLVEFFI
jgi:hypothetical protein